MQWETGIRAITEPPAHAAEVRTVVGGATITVLVVGAMALAALMLVFGYKLDRYARSRGWQPRGPFEPRGRLDVDDATAQSVRASAAARGVSVGVYVADLEHAARRARTPDQR